MRVIDAVKETIADVSSVNPSSELMDTIYVNTTDELDYKFCTRLNM